MYAQLTCRIANRGLSPLTRGKLRQHVDVAINGGLIPTHTGKTSSFSWLLRRSAAHTHSRGENDRDVATAVSFTGSSPLTQGKPRRQRQLPPVHGLIPTRVGNT